MRDDTPPVPDPAASSGDRPPFMFSLDLLADPDTDPSGHRREWFRVHEHFQPRLSAFWRGRVPNQDERDALLQETWVRTLFNIRKLRAPGVMWRWLLTVSDHVHRDQQRRRATGARQADRAAAAPPERLTGAAPPDALHQLALQDEIDVLLEWAGLDAREQRILRRWAVGVPHEELVTEFQLSSAANSRKMVERLLKRVRRAHKSLDRSASDSAERPS